MYFILLIFHKFCIYLKNSFSCLIDWLHCATSVLWLAVPPRLPESWFLLLCRRFLFRILILSLASWLS